MHWWWQQACTEPAHLDDVSAVVVQVPQLAVVALVRPPEGILLQELRTQTLSASSSVVVKAQHFSIAAAFRAPMPAARCRVSEAQDCTCAVERQSVQ